MCYFVNYDKDVLLNLQTKELSKAKNLYNQINQGPIMISEQIFYLFLFPWIIFIATIPGSVITYLFAGLGAQICNYLPEKTETDELN